MGVRRRTANRLTLLRPCHICGQMVVTTADTPYMRQMYNVDGKKQKTVYFCSEACKRASYKYKGWYDGLAEQRRKEREQARDISQKNHRYYQAHAEKVRARAKARYWADREARLADQAFQRRKRKMMEVAG